MSSVIAIADNSIYPALFVDYLMEIVPLTSLAQAAIKIGVVLVAMFFNIIGVDIVGSLSFGMTLLVLSPFAVMVLFGLPQLDPVTWIYVPKFTVSA